jgi:hypothetical protein
MQRLLVGAEDPDLIATVPAARREAARNATAAVVMYVGLGPWRAGELRGPPGHYGLLVLEGLLAREVSVGHRSCVELLGAGDLLKPWTGLGDDSTIAIDARWDVRSELRIAVLDRAFAQHTAPFPEIGAALMDRLLRRSRWLAFHLAVCHLPKLETRLRVVFWYIADRWGRVTPDGIVVPLRLTHDLLGGLVGAQRSPVSRALRRLADTGSVVRQNDGTWRIRGDPPPELPDTQARAVGGEPAPARSG